MTGRTTTTRVYAWRAALGIVALALLAEYALAQTEPTKPSLFGSVQLSNNLSFSSIPAYDNSYECGTFQQGHKWFAPSFRIGASLPQGPSWSFGGALMYHDLSTNYTLNAQETPQTPLARDPFGNYVAITRTRTLDVSLSMLAASLFASYEVLPRFAVTAGPYAGFLTSHSLSQSEAIASPSGAVYADNNRSVRAVSSAAFNVHPFQAGFDLNASYELYFQPNLWLRPSFGVMLPVTSISDRSTSAWRILPTGFALGLVYRTGESPPPAAIALVDTPFREPVPDVAPVEAPQVSPAPVNHVLSVSISAFGVNEDGTEVEEPLLTIERLHVTEVYPMLHYVFFDDGASKIPSRYHQRTAAERDAFEVSSLFTSGALEIHHNVLDILGRRLHDDPSASVTLVGARSIHSRGDAARGQAISRERAESVAQYFETVWDVAPNRLHVRVRDLPDVASDDLNAFGEAENRRVEIIPSRDGIAAPLHTERIERVATPPHISFYPEIVSSAGVRSATIEVRERDRVLRSFDALTKGTTGAYVWTLDEQSMPDRRDSLNYTIVVIDSLGDTAKAEGTIHLRQKIRNRTVHITDTTLDKEVEKYSLILFDYSSSQLDRKQAEGIIHDMAGSILKGSQVTLTGHTDKTGDDQFNEKLARDRVTRAADMLQAALRRSGKGKPSMLVESHGSRDDLFDNSIPEGRVLSRTVRALIENEVR
ncbi:MAG: OmpA family protein [Bacteroidota bacterium]|nr:OmpA family protein [Bacteroidota bacterium]MDP4234083.1 OmpA family protein [Bacteroidota bacterium]MDP4243024.1 OmpA family protein [Bacteroidota bacterium]MDP4287450.1 OmpA family protein [Bacteroidota bacterium]